MLYGIQSNLFKYAEQPFAIINSNGGRRAIGMLCNGVAYSLFPLYYAGHQALWPPSSSIHSDIGAQHLPCDHCAEK